MWTVSMLPFKRKSVPPDEVRAGDIIGFSGRSWVSVVINLATYGIPLIGISHVGIMARCPDGELRLFESTSLDDIPCEITGKVIHGTQAHKLGVILNHYAGRAYHYPLYRALYPQEDARLTEFLVGTLGTPYDKLGAIRSAGVGLSWIESLLHEQCLASIFCSEWTAAAYANVGLFATDNVSRWSPNKFVRRLRRAEILLKPRRLR